MDHTNAVRKFWNATEKNAATAAAAALKLIPAEVVNACDDDDYDMLISAVQNGDACAVRVLLASGKCDLAHRENLCGMTAREIAQDYPAGSPMRRAFEEYDGGND